VNLVLEFRPTRFARTQAESHDLSERKRGKSRFGPWMRCPKQSPFFLLLLHASPCPWWLLDAFCLPLLSSRFFHINRLPSTNLNPLQPNWSMFAWIELLRRCSHGWGGEDVRKGKTPTRRNQVSQMTRRRWAELDPCETQHPACIYLANCGSALALTRPGHASVLAKPG